MIKIFFIYALIAGVLMTFYGFIEMSNTYNDIEAIKKEYELSNIQIYTIFYLLLFVLGWVWLPYLVIKGILK